MIDIQKFNGLFTNADEEDLSPEYLTELQNMRPVNGKLVRTYGIGKLIDTALAVAADNIYTFIDDNLSGDKIYLAVYINGTTKAVTIYGYSAAPTPAWIAIGTGVLTDFAALDTYYHLNGQNQIIFADNILRILPGRTALPDTSHAGRGIWIGYINRNFFDGLYLASTYGAKFFNYPCNLFKPAFTVSHLTPSNGPFNTDGNGEAKYYRMSYVYDGIQESLLSDTVSVDYPSTLSNKVYLGSFGIFQFAITKASHEKRITAIKIYRTDGDIVDGSKSKDDIGGPFKLIHTIDLLRLAADKEYRGTANGYSGRYEIYVYGITHTFNAGYDYKFKVGTSATLIVVDNPGAGAKTIFHRASSSFSDEHWNESWELWEDDGGGYDKVEEGTSGLYCGMYVVIVDEDLGINNLAGGALVAAGGLISTSFIIEYNYRKAIKILAPSLAVDAAYDVVITNPTDGNYYIEDDTPSSGDVKFTFFDTGMRGGEAYPLLAEKSIDINAKFNRTIGGRLWMGNIILDPEGVAEVHNDWGAYSELDQYDNHPVSNVMTFPDREGGECKGIAEIFGNPVFLKRQGIFLVDVKSSLSDPSRWFVRESVHNIGNLADYGFIEAVGALFVCYHDGIYRLYPNNIAGSDTTPTERLKITDSIEDIYLGLTLSQKENIVSSYDPLRNEIVFKWLRTIGGTPTQETYAHNVNTEEWRQINTGVAIGIMSKDENSQIMVYNSTDKKIYSFDNVTYKESSLVSIKTKTFDVSSERKGIVRAIWVTYKSAVALTLKIFLENSATAETTTYTLPIAITSTTYKVSLKVRAKKIKVEIGAAASTSDIEIHRIQIEHD